MSSRPVEKPRRIPPKKCEQAPPAGRETQTAPTAALNLGPDDLTKDAFLLQAQLDHLAEQFSQLKAQLRQAQKLASIGATAAMIAHEFNNLFTPVVAYAKHALDTGDVELMRSALKHTLTQTATMHAMADRVIGLAKQSDTSIRAVDLRELVENTLACLGRKLAKQSTTVNLQIDPALAVRANENQLMQVLFNVVTNARQAMLDRRGRLTIDAVPTRDGRVLINVRDTGCGIPPEHLGRVFEPFFSTKQATDRPDRRGLGLGLSICRDIIEELGGTIEVSSEVNVGTTFTITLPKAE